MAEEDVDEKVAKLLGDNDFKEYCRRTRQEKYEEFFRVYAEYKRMWKEC